MRWFGKINIAPFKNFLLIVACIGWPGAVLPGCRDGEVSEPEEFFRAKEIVFAWNELLLELEQHTPGYRPPVSARMFAYVGMAAYEAALPDLPGYLSMSEYCPGYKSLQPAFPYSGDAFFLPASLNAAYAEIIRQFFPTAPPHLQERIFLLESETNERLRKQANAPVFRQSAAFGKEVAFKVWRWSITDSIGHDGYLFNYDRSYVPPAGPGLWQPCGEHPMPALLPHWGQTRTFVVSPEKIAVRPPANYDEWPGSAFYTEAMEVFTISQPLSRENRWIAEFWSDDVPGLTVSPAGRWIAIANQALQLKRPFLPELLETYLRLGMGLSDVFVVCWESKYRFNRHRPEAYICRLIRPDWRPLHENPSFPGYPSGHSAAGAAAAEILSATLGDTFSFTDRTHEHRPEFQGNPRTFDSFVQMAHENAFSRVALGVHFRMDCEEGLRIGRMIGKKVIALPLNSDKALAN